MDHDARVDGRRRASTNTPNGKFVLLLLLLLLLLLFLQRSSPFTIDLAVRKKETVLAEIL